MNKFVYFEPRGGFNDILCNIERCLNYCKENQRILLINGTKSVYNINFFDYFDFSSNTNAILDTEKIKEICLNKEYTIYPTDFQNKMEDILKGNITFSYPKDNKGWIYKDIKLELFNIKLDQDIIVYCCCGGGNGYPLFQQLIFKKNLIDLCKERHNKLKTRYLGIQIRNTDRNCDYIKFYSDNEKIIKSYNEIYLATDDINALQFFRNKCQNIVNFTTFPIDKYRALHISNIDPHTKFIDMFCDLFILSLSDILLSPSQGHFIELIKTAKKNNHFRQVI